MNPKVFVSILEKKKSLYSFKDEDLAKAIHVCEKTFKRKKKKPGSFSIDDVNYLMKFLRFNDEERKEVYL